MITTKANYQYGQTKTLGIASLNDNDIEQAEKEVFLCVFSGVTYDEVDQLPEGAVRTLFVQLLTPFAFCQLAKNRNAYLKMQGEVTDGATAYGNTTTSRLLTVWNNGVTMGGRLFEANKALLVAEFEAVDFVAKIKL